MAALYKFDRVATDKVASMSFVIVAGDAKILQVASNELKAEVIDLLLGELAPLHGEISLQGQPLEASKNGSIGWIPVNGGLISNLKAWENITLPLWYHNRRQPKYTEEMLARWLRELNIDSMQWEEFMSSPAARLKPFEKKLAGLLRALLQAPQLLVVDAGLFDEVDVATINIWTSTLEKFVAEADGRALLVVASSATALPWKIIE